MQRSTLGYLLSVELVWCMSMASNGSNHEVFAQLERELIRSGAVGAGEFWQDLQGSFGSATNFGLVLDEGFKLCTPVPSS